MGADAPHPGSNGIGYRAFSQYGVAFSKLNEITSVLQMSVTN